MKNKELPNKLTNLRLIFSIVIILILLFPFNMININFNKYIVDDVIIVDLKMVIVGILFLISSVTDYLDGYLARKNNAISDYGKLMDPIADKLLVDGTLIILAAYGYIHAAIPVIVVMRDMIVNAFRMVAISSGIVEPARSTGKLKTAFLMIGIILKLFGNYPFGLMNIAVDDFFLIAGTILSIISGFEYSKVYKKYINTVNKE